MELFQLTVGEGPLVAAAIHNGHLVRDDVASLLAISETDRRREEDPHTADLIAWAPTRLVGLGSRYEVDLNRPREEAVYLKPEHSWGVNIWKQPPGKEVIRRSLADYDLFFATAHTVLKQLVEMHGVVVVLDVHSYNHRRAGPTGAAAEPADNPEVNVGTGSLDRQRWGPLVDRFIGDLRAYDISGRQLDVRENVRFFGGHFPRWIHQTFPNSVCALAVEFKKFFMDEWTGEVDRAQLAGLASALKSTHGGLLESLAQARQSPNHDNTFHYD
jgi:N-formylglutamate amidohydrolase